MQTKRANDKKNNEKKLAGNSRNNPLRLHKLSQDDTVLNLLLRIFLKAGNKRASASRSTLLLSFHFPPAYCLPLEI